MPGHFTTGTQSKHWLLSKEQVDALRAKTRHPAL
eukprot:COSAG05_NODE_14292_length_401_cov_1.185430_1_plen_33_part_01